MKKNVVRNEEYLPPQYFNKIVCSKILVVYKRTVHKKSGFFFIEYLSIQKKKLKVVRMENKKGEKKNKVKNFKTLR